MEAARRQFFDRNPVRGMRRSQRRAIESFAALRAQDPKRYDEKVKGDKDTKIGPFNIEAELEGRGVLSKIAETAKKGIDKIAEATPNVLKGPKGPNVVQLPSQKKSGIGAGGKELIDLAANLPSGLYMGGAAVKEAVQGRPQRAKEMWREFKKTSALAAAASGDWREAAKRAAERPITTALELSGAKSVVGRTTGAAARHAPSKRVRAFASTERENLRLYPHAKPGKGPEIERRYSRDLINNRIQKALDKRAKKKGRDPNVDRGSLLRPSMPRSAKGGGIPTLDQPLRSHLLRRVDTRVHAQQRAALARKRRAEQEAQRLVRGTKLKGKRRRFGLRRRVDAGAGIQLAAEGVIRVGSLRRDLTKRLNDLAREYKNLTDPQRRKLNREEAKHIRELLNLNDENLARVVAGAEEFARSQAGVQKRGQRTGIFDEKGAATRFFPALQTHVRREARVEKPTVRTEAPKPLTKREKQRIAKQAIEEGRDPKKAIRDAELRQRSRTPGELKQALKQSQAARRYSREERAVIAAAVQRRFQKGKSLPPHAAALVERLTGLEPGQRPPRPRPGQSKLLTRGDLEQYVSDLRRQPRREGARRLTPEELRTVARTLQRRSRKGKSTLSRMPEGGPALITQRPSRLGLFSRLRPSAPLVPAKERTGSAFQQGARQTGREAVVRQAVESEAIVTATEGFQLLDREFGIPAGRGGRRYAATRDEALAAARRLTLDKDGNPLPNSIDLVPVNIASFYEFGNKLRARQKEGLLQDAASINRREMEALRDAWRAAWQESGRGKWVLMPEPVVRRLTDHLEVGNFGPMHTITNTFKDVVLTSASPARWIGGNIADITFRTIAAGITPFDIVRGRRVAREAKKRGLQGEQAVAATTGGGLYHASEALSSAFRPPGVPRNKWVNRTIVAPVWRAWKGMVYAVEHAIEELPQHGTIGKELRRDASRFAKPDGEMKRSLRSLLLLHDAQIDWYAGKLATNRAFEARIQKATEDVIGRWGKVSPNMRRALLLAPFAQWLGAAVRYVYITLPAHHPIKTGVMAGVMQMTEEERKKLGLSYFAHVANRVQDYQMGALPLKVKQGKFGQEVYGIPTSRMFSFGTAAEAPNNIGDFLFPQFAGVLDTLEGQSFTGEDMVYPEWWPDQSLVGLKIPKEELRKIALGALIESSAPFASAFRRAILEKGQPSEPFSTILTPATRRKWDKEHKRYTENEGTTIGGILEWLMPVPAQSSGKGVKFAQRLYTQGASRDIEQRKAFGRGAEQIRKEREKRKTRTVKKKDSGGEYQWTGEELVDPQSPKPTPTPRPKREFRDSAGTYTWSD